MQPITYSLIINLAALLVSGLLAWLFSAPWLVIVALVLQTHALDSLRQHSAEEEEEEQPMGFTANVK